MLRIKIYRFGVKCQKVICMVCNAKIGLNFGCRDSGISHGICDNCFNAMKEVKHEKIKYET